MMTGRGVIAVLLAGGRARRMGGGDKALIDVAGHPMLERVIARARPQADHLVLNANGDPGRFAAFGLPVISDPVEGFAGPLAGILAALQWAADTHPACHWVVSIATDTPFFPADMIARMLAAVKDDRADMACARSAGRSHPVFGLWPVALGRDLAHALIAEDIRKIDRWTARYRVAPVSFACGDIDPFFNINTPEDVAIAERHLKKAAA